MYGVEDFINLRRSIIKNAILNKIISGFLMGQEQFCVAEAILCTRDAKDLAGSYQSNAVDCCSGSPKNSHHFPNYEMASIIVAIANNVARVGYYFPKIDLPTIWGNQTFTVRKMMDLKNLAEHIYREYRIHPCKTDPVFSDMPACLSILLESKNISANIWKTGLSKPLKHPTNVQVDRAELEKYYKCLKRRRNEWRICNTILVSLYKRSTFECNNPSFGELTVNPIPEGNVCIRLYNTVDSNCLLMVLSVDSINPSTFGDPNSDISNMDLVHFNKI